MPRHNDKLTQKEGHINKEQHIQIKTVKFKQKYVMKTNKWNITYN